jgi:predicted regulator of Ras-like GTPase activity (Roadblock/LC7/MglB family)
MNPSKKVLTNLLKDLEVAPDIEASAVSSTQGYMIASTLPQYAEDDRIAFMSAALLLLGEQTAKELALGKVSNVYVRGKEGCVVVMTSGEDAVITLLAQEGAQKASVLDMKQMAENVVEGI